MIEISKKSNVKVSGIFQHRFHPVMQTIFKHIKLGTFGKLHHGFVDFKCTRTEEYYNQDEWRGDSIMEGGSTLINQAIHTIDTILQIFGRPVYILGDISRTRITNIDTEDEAHAVLYYDNNIDLKIDAVNNLKDAWFNKITIESENVKISVLNSNEVLELETNNQNLIADLEEAKKKENEFNAPGKKEYGSYHSKNFDDFIDSILNNRNPLVTIDSASVANEVVLGIYDSSSKKNKIELPIVEYKYMKL